MIPQEIRNFFEISKEFIFLIKGYAGSGKTIFALTLLKELNEKSIYITNIKREVLVKLHPWIESLPITFVDIKSLSLKPKICPHNRQR